jgi:hypothetical protein
MRRNLSGKMEAKRNESGRDKERNDEPLSKLSTCDAALVSIGRAYVPAMWSEAATGDDADEVDGDHLARRVVRLIHAGFRCPDPQCAGHQRTYRSPAADAASAARLYLWARYRVVGRAAAPGKHQTVDEVHEELLSGWPSFE